MAFVASPAGLDGGLPGGGLSGEVTPGAGAPFCASCAMAPPAHSSTAITSRTTTRLIMARPVLARPVLARPVLARSVLAPAPPRRLRHRRQRRLVRGPGQNVVDDELVHLIARIHRRRAEMRKQNNVLHLHQLLWHFRLLGVNIETCRHDSLVLERLDQSRLVDH